MPRVLLADPLDPSGRKLFEEAGVEVHQLADDERERLTELIADFDAMVVRSRTKVTADILRAGRRLKVVGRAGIGVDNVDIQTATELGILVVNAPTANLISATEHTFALLLALARNVPAANASLLAGEWNRKGFVGTELQGKTLGVVGFGRIGQAVAQRAQAFEMQVVAYDPFLDASLARRLDVELLELDDLLARADCVTLHTPLTDGTRNLLNADRFAAMKPGALLVNCARGGVVDEKALLAALEEGRLAGAALDVFEVEPPPDLSLIRHPRVVSTPHLGAQTREAQERVATETVRMLLAALEGSLAVTAVNLPFRSAGTRGEPWLALGEQLGRLASALVPGTVSRVDVGLWGVEEALRTPLTVAVAKGVLTPALGEAVNYVNAERLAASRGVEVVRSTHGGEGEYAHLVEVKVSGESGSAEIAGTLFGDNDPRVVRFSDYRLEFRPSGRILVLENRDVPGVVGRLGTLLGEAGVNIADIHLARNGSRERAVAVLHLDQDPSADVVARIDGLDEVERVQVIDLGS